MKTKAHRNTTPGDSQELGAKLDNVTRALQDLFILQALLSGAGRDPICKMLGIHTRRVSKINVGLKKKARK